MPQPKTAETSAFPGYGMTFCHCLPKEQIIAGDGETEVMKKFTSLYIDLAPTISYAVLVIYLSVPLLQLMSNGDPSPSVAAAGALAL